MFRPQTSDNAGLLVWTEKADQAILETNKQVDLKAQCKTNQLKFLPGLPCRHTHDQILESNHKTTDSANLVLLFSYLDLLNKEY